MELFQKKIGPVFLKEDSDATVFINKMHQLESKATSNKKFKNRLNSHHMEQ